jgi:replication-associated recombination protein RarA
MGENDPKPFRFSEQVTPGGYVVGEVTSAMHKSIRRGHEREALWWSSELDLAGYGAYVWRRLKIAASEDVGLAAPDAVIQIRVLYEAWLEAKKAKHQEELPLFIAHAVCVLARAAKSGIALYATLLFWEGDREAMRIEVPDYAIDAFTTRGRRRGRGKQFFLEESGRMENEVLPNPYREDGGAAWLAAGKPKREESKREEPAGAPADQLALGGEDEA